MEVFKSKGSIFDTLKLILEENIRVTEERMSKREEEDEKFCCGVCMSTLVPEDGNNPTEEERTYTFKNCPHTFHLMCLEPYFENEVKANKFPLVCPDPKCKTEVTSDELKFLLPKNLIDNFWNQQFDQFVARNDNFIWCPTPDCGYAMAFNLENGDCHFNCIKCGKQYCINCKTPWHDGKTC